MVQMLCKQGIAAAVCHQPARDVLHRAACGMHIITTLFSTHQHPFLAHPKQLRWQQQHHQPHQSTRHHCCAVSCCALLLQDGTEKSRQIFITIPTEVGQTEAEEIGEQHQNSPDSSSANSPYSSSTLTH